MVLKFLVGTHARKNRMNTVNGTRTHLCPQVSLLTRVCTPRGTESVFPYSCCSLRMRQFPKGPPAQRQPMPGPRIPGADAAGLGRPGPAPTHAGLGLVSGSINLDKSSYEEFFINFLVKCSRKPFGNEASLNFYVAM